LTATILFAILIAAFELKLGVVMPGPSLPVQDGWDYSLPPRLTAQLVFRAQRLASAESGNNPRH
jgi:hypothetical protein